MACILAYPQQQHQTSCWPQPLTLKRSTGRRTMMSRSNRGNFDTMSAWDRTCFEFNDHIQKRGGIWAGSIPWNSAPGRSISQDDYVPPMTPTAELPASASASQSRSRERSPVHEQKWLPQSPVELPADVPLFRDATSSWSPPPSPGARSRSSTLSLPSSSRADSARALDSPIMPALTVKEKRKLGEKLYAASLSGDLDRIKLLLSLGAPINSSVLIEGLYETFKPAKSGRLSPLAGAASHGQLAAVQLLLSEGAELNPHVNTSSTAPLTQAIRSDELEITKYLLACGADVNSQNCYKTTPLMSAVKYASPAIVQLVLSNNPDLNQRSFIGIAAIHWAVFPDRPEIIDMLMEAGADVNMAQMEGSTPLHNAACLGHVATVECLLRWGADVGRRNEGYQTALEVAVEHGHGEVAALIKAAEARRRSS